MEKAARNRQLFQVSMPWRDASSGHTKTPFDSATAPFAIIQATRYSGPVLGNFASQFLRKCIGLGLADKLFLTWHLVENILDLDKRLLQAIVCRFTQQHVDLKRVGTVQ